MNITELLSTQDKMIAYDLQFKELEKQMGKAMREGNGPELQKINEEYGALLEEYKKIKFY